MGTIKVLIVGSYGFFTNALVQRLAKEGCEIYMITGKNSKSKGRGLPKHINYDFDLNDSLIQNIIDSIAPDAMVFMGAQDTSFYWDSNADAAVYNAAVSNVLTCASNAGVKHMVYLSSTDVYGMDYDTPVTEKTKPCPTSIRGLTLLNGEGQCKIYNENTCLKSVVLRLPMVYGPQANAEEAPNFMTRSLFYARMDIPFECDLDLEYKTIFIGDAVDAVYRAIANTSIPKGTYNVEGNSYVSNREIINMVEKITQKKMRVVDQKSAGKGCTCNPVGSLYEKASGYKPIVTMESGIERTYKWVISNFGAMREIFETKKKKSDNAAWEESKKRMKNIAKGLLSYIESIALCALACLGTYLASEYTILSGIDFFVIYIIIMSVVYSVTHSYISIFLSSIMYVAMKMAVGLEFTDIIMDYTTLVRILFYFLVGILVGYSKDRLKLKNVELMEEKAAQQEELERIYDISERHIQIKKMFEERLINYDNSIAKVYSIVSQLDLLDPEKIVSSALDVIMQIMGVNDVAIYVKSNEGLYRMTGCSSRRAQKMKNIINLDDYDALEGVLLEERIFVNRKMDANLPSMVAPVFSEQNMIYMIMLFNMDFDKMTLYQENLFSVLSKIIASSFEKAYRYQNDTKDSRYMPGTKILLAEAFTEIVKTKVKGAGTNIADFAVLKAPVDSSQLMEKGAQLAGILRDNDYIGLNAKDPNSLLLLLNNTSEKDLPFVYKKIARIDLTAEVVSLDEYRL
ncbi:MAG: NAD-dependent epimerase/dehydratase family protein [Acutalibacteraceae bacterium]